MSESHGTWASLLRVVIAGFILTPRLGGDPFNLIEMADRLEASAENQVPRAPPIPVFRPGLCMAYHNCKQQIPVLRAISNLLYPTLPRAGSCPRRVRRGPWARRRRATTGPALPCRSYRIQLTCHALRIRTSSTCSGRGQSADRKQVYVYRAAARLWASGVLGESLDHRIRSDV